jgi:hypothetical protein
MAEDSKERKPAEAPERRPESPKGLISPGWLAPQPRLRLVNGIWVAVPAGAPLSSSARAGQRKPVSMREKLEREAAEKAEKHAAPKAEA